MKVKIKSIWINSDFKGKPFITSKGEPYKTASLTSENGNKAKMFIWNNEPEKLAEVQSWRSGDTVEVEITKKGEHINFNLPKFAPALKENPKTLNTATPQSRMLTNADLVPKRPIVDPIKQIAEDFGGEVYGQDPDEHTPDPISGDEIPW